MRKTLTILGLILIILVGLSQLLLPPIAEKTLLERAKAENARNGNFSLVLRADKDIDYGMVYALLDKFKGAGITRFGLAGESAGGK